LRIRFLVFAAAAAVGAWAQSADSVVLQAMRAELNRSMDKLKSQPVPPYFLSYEITETHSVYASGEFGMLNDWGENRHRQLDIDLRVGDYRLDNTRQIRGGFRGYQPPSQIEVPLDADADAIRGVLWYHTDQQYKQAVEQLTKVKTNVEVKVAQEDKSSDFSREEAQSYREDALPDNVDLASWKEKVKKYTAPFAKYGDIYQASASLTCESVKRWFVNSEGTVIQVAEPRFRLGISAFTKADDGMELPRYETWFSFTAAGLPDDATVLKTVDRMIRDLQALRVAPVVDPYAGPAILSGRAAGVFFHEVFGHRVEGHRQKSEDEGQTFKKKIGEQVLNEAFSVYFDPTVRNLAGQDLAGSYRYDNQGVKARRVTVVENGVLKTFLMSRAPIEGFPVSNGHGRKQPGLRPVSRQSNLIVEVAPSAVRPDLKALLIEAIRKEGKPFGLYFEDILGGFTMTGRTIPNSFNVLPNMVYRIYPDGREELVRGVDIIGTPLTTFGKIVAADRRLGVFDGVCGAESGMVPVSAVSPGIFISQLEAQKKDKSQERPPILPAPFEAN
jgi:predicted Zn-dependent protease